MSAPSVPSRDADNYIKSLSDEAYVEEISAQLAPQVDELSLKQAGGVQEPQGPPPTENIPTGDPASHSTTSDDEDEQTILERCYEQLSEAPDLADMDLLDGFAHLGNSYMQEYETGGTIHALRTAIIVFREVVSNAPDDHPGRRRFLSGLGNALLTQWEVDGRPDDFQEGFRCYESAAGREDLQVSDLISDGNSEDTAVRRQLGQFFMSASASLGPDPWADLIGMGQGALNMFPQTRDLHHLRTAIVVFREVLGQTPEGHHHRIFVVLRLGDGLRERYSCLQQNTDIRQAIFCHTEGLKLCNPEHPLRERVLDSLGLDFTARFKAAGDVLDLDIAIRMLRQALKLCPPGHPNYTRSLNNLSAAIFVRLEQMGDPKDLNRVIDLQHQALAARPVGHRDRWTSLNNLGGALLRRFQMLSESSDLDEAVRLHREALDEPSLPVQRRATSLHNLANTYSLRFAERGAVDDLEEAAVLTRAALDLHPPGHPQRAQALSSLANALAGRFEQLGTADDLDDAVRLHREALTLRPTGNPDRWSSLNNLSTVLFILFEQLRAVTNLEESIGLDRQALSLRAQGHPDRAMIMKNLANGLHRRYLELNTVGDLVEAINLYREAMVIYGAGDALILNSLAAAVLSRFSRTTAQKDMDEVVILHEQALALRPPGHPLRYSSLINLGSAYATQYLKLREVDAAVRAKALMADALTLLPEGHAQRAGCLYALSWLHTMRGTPFFDIPTALLYLGQQAVDSHRAAGLRLIDALRTLREVQSLPEFEEKHRAQLLDVFIMTVRLLPHVAYFGLDVGDRLDALRKAESLALDAAGHALLLGRSREAVEVLEEGRAVFWTQALRLRTAFDDVPAQTRERLVELARRLEQDSLGGRDRLQERETQTKAARENETTTRKRLSNEFDALVAKVRELPGLERFMLQREFDELAKAADQGPVVLLVGSKVACEALVLTAGGEAARVPLKVKVEDLQRMSMDLKTANGKERSEPQDRLGIKRTGMTASEIILRELWIGVVQPVVAELGLKATDKHRRPRLWWCPTGQFSFLPIHAAGIYSGLGAVCCSDFFVSSYTPTLSTLLNARKVFEGVSAGEAKVLLAAVPSPYQGSQILATIREVQAIRDVIQSESVLPLPPADNCLLDPIAGVTVPTILAQLPLADILHLACHGVQDGRNPLESGFLMRDGKLTMARLMSMTLPRASLAFLSACESAKGDSDQPDQTVHLAATMLFAGFRSVVATMWTMADLDGPVVANAVYEELFKEGKALLDLTTVPFALDAAARRIRQSGGAASRWATFVHLGI